MLKKFKPNLNPTHTPKIHPALGLLSLLGFLGLLGFVPTMTYSGEISTIPTLFFFFGFFGWAGLYYQGKMSGTFIDERFKFNKTRASSLAYKSGFVLLFSTCVLVKTAINGGLLAIDQTAIAILIAAAGFSLALFLFLDPYLLYKYENEE